MRAIAAFIQLSRLHFLFGGALMYAIGVASGGEVSIGGYLLGQLMVTSAQLTAHYVNEYADVEADRLVTNRTFFSGGSGALVDDDISPKLALHAARTTSAVAVAAMVGVALLAPAAALLGGVALAVSWGYSMPPARLLNTGWGELVTSLVVVVVVPMIGAFISGAPASPALWWAMAVLLPVHIAMMLVFEIPDSATDREAGKTVLAVRLGEASTIGLIGGLYLLSALALIVFAPASSENWNGVWMGLTAGLLVVGVFLALRKKRFGWATSFAVFTLVLPGAFFLASFL